MNYQNRIDDRSAARILMQTDKRPWVNTSEWEWRKRREGGE